jgi:hypothetical protein
MNLQPEKPVLRLDWCSHEAAKYAVEHWHYSRSMPAGKGLFVGVWECSKYIGAIVFSRGASNHIGSPYGLQQTECCELTRVALTVHIAPVSRLVAIALRFLKSCCPGIRLIVSYADPAEGHNGGIYQAGNWVYTGKTSPDFAIIDAAGKRWHSRMVSKTGIKKCFGTPKRVIRPDQGRRVDLPGKHRYLMPLDAEMRNRILPLSKPYPKRAGGDTKDTAGNLPAEGGSTPTPALHPEGNQCPS